MKIRTTKPKNNKYYLRKASGGYSDAIKGYPCDPKADVLSNCVGYANSRFAEIQGKKKIEYQLVCNAENFIERAKAMGLKISKTPVVGGIMVWQKGATLNNYDGAGHVAIVEKIIDEDTIYTSESAYAGTAFFNATRSNKNGRWGMGEGYKFRGCIVNPAVKAEKPKPAKKKTVTEIAKEVIAGKWGNGDDRKAALIKAGYDYDAVQAKVSELIDANKSKPRKYKVVSKSGMNVRKTATTNSAVVGTLNYGQVFTSTKQSNGWAYCDARKGWVKIGKDYIKEV